MGSLRDAFRSLPFRSCFQKYRDRTEEIVLMTDLQTPILFLDFDGTISRRDAVDAILETYAEPKWLAFEADWRAGRIGSRDCLRAQMSLVRASQKQIDGLLDEIGIDEELVALLEVCVARGIPVHIIS